MADAARPDRVDETAIAERRRSVAALYLAHQTQTAIARRLSVAQSTVSEDLTALKEEWRRESLDDLSQIIEREAHELDEMERRAAMADAKCKTPEWFDRRLKCKERRARLLGLDQPQKADFTSGGQSLSADLLQVLMGALAPFPEARAHVAAQLVALEAANEGD